MGEISLRDARQAELKLWRLPIAFYAIAVAFYSGFVIPGGVKLFTGHPFSMAIGAIALPSVAALTKKVGGLQNTKLHGYMMWASSAAMLLGFYFIYTNKDLHKKQHFTSYHSWAGLIVVAMFSVTTIGSTVALHPEFGLFRTQKEYRALHKLFGRNMVVLAIAVCCSGVANMEENIFTSAALLAPIIAIVYIVLK